MRIPISDGITKLVHTLFPEPTAPEALAQRLPEVVLAWNRAVLEVVGDQANPTWRHATTSAPPTEAKLLNAAREQVARHPSLVRLVAQAQLMVDEEGRATIRTNSLSPLITDEELETSEDVVITSCLLERDLSAAQARQRVRRLHRAKGQRALREAIASPWYGEAPWIERNARILGNALEGIGRQVGPLLRIVEDPGSHPGSVRAATALLLDHAPDQLRGVLSVDQIAEHSAGTLLSMLEEGHTRSFAEALGALPHDVVDDMLGWMEEMRSERGVPPSIWTLVASEPAAAPHRERLRALSNRIDLSRGTSLGLLSHPDGQGAYQVFVVDRAPDGHHVVAGLVVREAEGLRDGLFFSGLRQDEADDLLERVKRISPLVEVPAKHLGRLIEDVAQRFPKSLQGHDTTTRLALDHIRAQRHGGAAPRPAPPGWDAPLETWRLRMQSAPLQRSWFLDRADMTTLDLSIDDTGTLPSEARIVERLVHTDRLHPRLIGALEASSRWWSAHGEEQMAGSFAAAAARIRQGPKVDDPFLHALAGRSLEVLASLADEDPADLIGDPNVRAHLQAALDVKRPRMSDLATLDLAEFFLAADWQLVRTVAGWSSPTAQAREQALLAAARAAVPALLPVLQGQVADVTSVDAAIARAMTTSLGTAPPPDIPTALRRLASTMLKQVCGSCPVMCWKRPGSGARDAWATLDHPARR